MKEKIRFKLFDGLKVYCKKEQCWKSVNAFSDHVGVGKKQQLFLAYLILNHKRRISAEELIEHFWAEKGDAPANSLKNMIYKTRKMLQVMFQNEDELLITRAGAYEWNPDYVIETDVSDFEESYKTIDYATPKGQEKAVKALSLYTGKILPGMSADWLDHYNTYYQALYIDISKAIASKFMEEERWDQIFNVCEQAYAVSPETEEFTTHVMRAYVANGMAKQAIRHYEDYSAMLLEQYNLLPSKQVEELHRLAEQMYREDGAEESIVQRLMEPSEEAGAFQCGMLVFQNIVQLELRHMQRYFTKTSIILLQTESLGEDQPFATDIRRLERILKNSLRVGDPFTKLNKGSYAVLLSGADEEDAKSVAERIERNFYNTYTRSRALLRFKIFVLSNA